MVLYGPRPQWTSSLETEETGTPDAEGSGWIFVGVCEEDGGILLGRPWSSSGLPWSNWCGWFDCGFSKTINPTVPLVSVIVIPSWPYDLDSSHRRMILFSK